MKRTLKTIIGIPALLALAFTAPAQEAGEPASAVAPSGPTQEVAESGGVATDDRAANELTFPAGAIKVGDIIGMNVVDAEGATLGRVHEVAVDVESGRIIGVILTTGGLLGIGTSKTAVPPAALVHDADDNHLQIDTGKERLNSAPRFDTSKWSEEFTLARLAAVYDRFGQGSSFDFVNAEGQTGKPCSIPESRLAGAQRASKVVGMSVTNLQDEALGDVVEIVLELSSGRVLALVVATGAFLGIRDGLSAIAAPAFRFSTDGKTLLIDSSKGDLEAAPLFRWDRWPDVSQTGTASAIFTTYAVEPYVRTGSLMISRSDGAGNPDKSQPVSQDGTWVDTAITLGILNETRALRNVSHNARHVSVVTSAGRTTLSGNVDTAEEKEIIGEIAGRYNSEDRVENLLEVNDLR